MTPGAETGAADVRLFRQTPQPGGLVLVEIRRIEADEYERITAAEALFDRFGSEWAHTQMIRHASAVFEAVDQLWVGLRRSADLVNPADAERVRWAVIEFARHVEAWLESRRSDDDAEIAEAARHALQSQAVAACGTLLKATHLDIAPVVRTEGDCLVAVIPQDGQHPMGVQLDIARILEQTMVECFSLAAAELSAAEDDLRRAGALLASLGAEVVYGTAVLAPALSEQGEQLQLQMRPLALHRVAPVLLALDRAKVKPPKATEPAVQSSAPADQEAAQPSDPTPQPVSRLPVDAAAMLEEVLDMAETVERRWLEALGEGMDDAVADVEARLGSYMAALLSQIQSDVAAAEDTGLAAVLPAMPLTMETAAALDIAPSGQTQVMQQGIAAVNAVENLVHEMKALSAPAVRRIEVPNGRVRNWWTPDVFSRLRSAAHLADRVLRDSDEAVEPQALLDRAVDAWEAGLPEAAAVYLVPVVEQLGLGDEDAYGVLQKVAARLAAGQSVPLSAVVPIVWFWLGTCVRAEQ